MVVWIYSVDGEVHQGWSAYIFYIGKVTRLSYWDDGTLWIFIGILNRRLLDLFGHIKTFGQILFLNIATTIITYSGYGFRDRCARST